MVSWGGVAMGEVRPTFDRPSKSAVLGMMGAALGVRQSEEEKHRAIANSYRFAVRLDVPGRLLRDYHTSEAPTGKRARGLTTRRDELNYRKTNTIESYRDYRCDARATVCIWSPDGDPFRSLKTIQKALRKPAFVLYLGRKACPPALPLSPTIVRAGTLREAFEASNHSDAPLTEGLEKEDTVRFYWEGDHDSGFEAEQSQTRRDQPASRARWTFEERRAQYTSLSRDEDAA